MIRVLCTCLLLLLVSATTLFAESASSPQEQAMSDTLDLWREGRYEQLFDTLAGRGSTSKERFVMKMRGTSIRPACCWQKLEQFKLVKEQSESARVYAKIGLEGTSSVSLSSTREFKLVREDDGWKMLMKDILGLAGNPGAKTKKR